MPIDRAATLRNAEKLLRQGKLDPTPSRSTCASSRISRATGTPPTRSATSTPAPDRSTRRSRSSARSPTASATKASGAKAAAVYKKILKLKPDHEHTLVQAVRDPRQPGAARRRALPPEHADRAAQGEGRRARRARRPGSASGSLDPADYEGRLTAASARIEMGDKAGALSDLKEIAGELAEKGRQAEAIEVLREAAKLNPDDEEIREKLLDVYFAAGDFAQARECATTVEQFRMLAAALEAAGQRRRGARHAAPGGQRSIPATPSCRRSSPAPSSPRRPRDRGGVPHRRDRRRRSRRCC